ncbi:molecular chaperone HtpG [Dyadobacter chenhuakuii]|uniref:Chaperone protein HtpG n=1 Tax=Dyadobacter chenhuakuii TaxID=2909339 RepID=A0A9X1U0N0_9BACT|nr:molecular chaperone HtpG [Dyadobacter chenhuakuii]MCF2494244.1 molecular chaperone HtpG [Dyadobacter chenhuakuii]MCF2498431.1 molecular chaperone HtpG [Dyadobacter chenhuakuii]USJ31371.1 molecular chaperone HtpG [Dyadobacter chenhuakuii]
MESVIQEKGNLSIHTENIFPIIKKFLYSDHEIFLRELVSNAVDASQKIKKLASYGEFNGELGELKVVVKLDKEAKTITISDNGIGMTADEIKKYINQIAFSGATEFVEKYKDKGEDGKGDKGIIGHFGLGFYSAYMVAENVEIITKSYKEGSEAVRWECDGSTEFELGPAEKAERGSDIILHIAADSEEFLDEHRLRGILEKYGKFLPIEIEFEEKIINNPNPIWTKNPSDLKDEDYLAFYKELYPFSEDPLFWIHLNVDYPFNLTGVLYFPKLKNDFQGQREKIQLYSRQVFITDEVKDIVPDFLQLLHGVIDSPDIPLNVSRSYLQADGNVKKINGYITRKVADKLSEIFKNDREGFEKKFDDIGLFVKYGIISDDKFYEKAKDFCLVKNTEGKFFTFEEYREHVKGNQTDKNDTQVWLYTTDEKKQDAFIQSAKKRSYDVLTFTTIIDSHFINTLEQKLEKVNVKRVDADTLDKLVEKDVTLESILSSDDQDKVKKIFEDVAGSKSAHVQVEAMPVDELPVVITFPEFMRRMTDMQATSGQRSMFGDMPLMYTVSLNANHPVISRVLQAENEEAQKTLAKQVFDLALLSQGLLSGSDLTQFIQRTVSTL